MPNFDAIIIGTGQSRPALARRLVAAGWKIAIIERKRFGGTCVNTGCTPTKTLIASAYAAHVTRRAADYGVRIEGSVNIDMKAPIASKPIAATATAQIVAAVPDVIQKGINGRIAPSTNIEKDEEAAAQGEPSDSGSSPSSSRA